MQIFSTLTLYFYICLYSTFIYSHCQVLAKIFCLCCRLRVSVIGSIACKSAIWIRESDLEGEFGILISFCDPFASLGHCQDCRLQSVVEG